MTCEISDTKCVVICSTYNEEYIGESGEGKARVQERVRVYQQHIRQLQYQKCKCEEHFWTCGKGEFKLFPFSKLHSPNKYWREQYEKYFRDKFKPTLQFSDIRQILGWKWLQFKYQIYVNILKHKSLKFSSCYKRLNSATRRESDTIINITAKIWHSLFYFSYSISLISYNWNIF